MNVLTAILLGLIQGLTEFFPVSSSSHLKLAKLALSIEVPVVFDLALHLGSLGALIFYFWPDLCSFYKGEKRKLLPYFIALLPLVPLTHLLSPLRQGVANIQYLGPFLIVTALFLFLGSYLRIKSNTHPKRDAFWIGVLQACALIPGISRSASTISCAKILGWSAQEAVRFSFLLAIPTIMGGTLLEGYTLFRQHTLGHIFNVYCMVGCVVAFGVGLIVVPFAMRLLMEGKLRRFAWYCLFLGIGTCIGMLYNK